MSSHPFSLFDKTYVRTSSKTVEKTLYLEIIIYIAFSKAMS
jgi:hypothetical protein